MTDPILTAYQRGQNELLPVAEQLRRDMIQEYPQAAEFSREFMARLTAVIGEGHARMNLRLMEGHRA